MDIVVAPMPITVPNTLTTRYPYSTRGCRSRLHSINGMSVNLSQNNTSSFGTQQDISHKSHPRHGRDVTTKVIPFERNSMYERPPPDLASFIFDHRIIYLGLPITPVVTNLIFAELLYLNSNKYYKDPIYLYINSTGTTKGAYKMGFESEALTLYDAMGYMVGTICTLAVGVAWGEAALLLAAGKKNKRGALRSSSIMLRQPLGRVQGQATQIDDERKNLRDMKQILVKLFSRHTGHSKEIIEQDMNRQKYFSPEQAIEYGLIDKVVLNNKRTDKHVGAFDPIEDDPFF